jgi:hypothetical protein
VPFAKNKKEKPAAKSLRISIFLFLSHCEEKTIYFTVWNGCLKDINGLASS